MVSSSVVPERGKPTRNTGLARPSSTSTSVHACAHSGVVASKFVRSAWRYLAARSSGCGRIVPLDFIHPREGGPRIVILARAVVQLPEQLGLPRGFEVRGNGRHGREAVLEPLGAAVVERADEVEDIRIDAARIRFPDEPRKIVRAVGQLTHDRQAEVGAGVRRIAFDNLAVGCFRSGIVEKDQALAGDGQREIGVFGSAPAGFLDRLESLFFARLRAEQEVKLAQRVPVGWKITGHRP